MRRLLAAVLACVVPSACTVPIVSTQRSPITWVGTPRHGHYEKAGVPLNGTTCGEQYQRAVAGVPEAERLMRECATSLQWYAVGTAGFVIAPATGAVVSELAEGGLGTAWKIGAAIGIVSFFVGYGAALSAAQDRAAAVKAYDATLP